MIVFFLLLGASMILGPLLGFIQVPTMTGVVLAGCGVISIVISIVLLIFSLYQKTAANEAMVRTGWGGVRVVIDGGCGVVPVVHRVIRVSLRTMKLTCKREGPDALITQDNLRVDVHSEFFMRVGADERNVLNAARSFGEDSGDEAKVEQIVGDKLVSSLRSVAAKHDLSELHSERERFAQMVQEMVAKEIEPNGLALETVTISRLDQTDPSHLNESNIFDAQGKRKITEITTAARTARNELERNAEQSIKEKDVTTRKAILTQEQAQAEAEAQQKARIAMVQAEREREAAAFAAEQQRLSQQARIAAEQAIAQSDIDRQKALIAAHQAQEVADVQRQQAVQTAQVAQAQAVEVANRDKQVAIADAEKKRAEAEAAQLAAEADKQKAAQLVATVSQVAAAEREKQVQIIGAQQAAEQKAIEERMTADIAAYGKVKSAEADQQSAQRKAEAVRTEAEAHRDALRLEAEGDQAVQVVPVNVQREQVRVDAERQTQVEAQRVAVLRQELEAKAQHQEVSVALQKALAEIEAQKAVGVAFAQSIGQMFSAGEMKMFGTPDMLMDALKKYAQGLGIGYLIEGAATSIPSEVKEGVVDLASNLGSVVEKLVGKKAEASEATPAAQSGGSES